MKSTAALKAELANLLDTNIGGTKEEIWYSNQEILEYNHSIHNQIVRQEKIRNSEIEVLLYGDYVMVNESTTDFYVKIEGECTYYSPFLMSCLLSKTDNGRIALHQYGSYPDMKSTEREIVATSN